MTARPPPSFVDSLVEFMVLGGEPATGTALPPFTLLVLSRSPFLPACCVCWFFDSFLDDAGAVLAAFGDIFLDDDNEMTMVSLVYWVDEA